MQFTTLFTLALASLTVAQEEKPLKATLYSNYGFTGQELVITEANTCTVIAGAQGLADGLHSIKLEHAFCYTFTDPECTLFFGQGYDTSRAQVENGDGQVAMKCLPYNN
ncbi:hypothetical protein PT974_01804 [Cladobotryum mycophilum]|uniref:Uncharacterized protein n=1 Tax=Cladobotryum mycophilum TaxID=491253 RepID=A0ABR0SXF0_9HYPO